MFRSEQRDSGRSVTTMFRSEQRGSGRSVTTVFRPEHGGLVGLVNDQEGLRQACLGGGSEEGQRVRPSSGNGRGPGREWNALHRSADSPVGDEWEIQEGAR
jgi:hypothetical protein